MIATRALDTPIGPLGLVATGDGLSRVVFHARGLCDEGVSPVLDAAEEQLDAYFAGELTEFDLPLDLDGTAFQRSCWLALATIPYGQTVSYGEQARRLGLGPDAARAVGAANGQNPLPLVLPCHRVIGADGSLTGFGGGLHVKRYLLELEGALLPLGDQVGSVKQNVLPPPSDGWCQILPPCRSTTRWQIASPIPLPL